MKRDERSAEVKQHERRAAAILDGMYQFVALLDPTGNILEVNRAALEGAGHRIEEIRGKPFWTARWWQISEPVRQDLKAAILRAAGGEFVRYEVDIYGEQSGRVPITIDFSLRPIRGESGEVEYLLPEGRNITERKRAEEQVARQAEELGILNERLKELDRLKTKFFANVSHEFRTPLTLMLGPLEDALANAHGVLPLGATKDLRVSHRNALRLLKLVNTMLDFSRIEAGRIQASYQPLDLAAVTAELASNFRSACEKAGLRLVVECPPLSGGELAYVDRDMWEKIVLNLVSNAFKFTLEGEIEVRLQSVDGQACLTVRDTGVGIPSEELPRMYERFHRVEHSRGRTHEGTGIGLALVQELVKLHGGTASVDSVLGEGSLFTVRIPLGKEHLAPERIGKAPELASTEIASSAFVEEAVRWLPDDDSERSPEAAFVPATACPDAGRAEVPAQRQRARILWADDNADMREYVSRLLGGRFDVQAVADGLAALDAARASPPDLVLSDVMMPRLDGFGLLRELRADPKLREIPIILLSARAGEESRIEGLEASADDYLIKPFSARELVARVETHVRMSRLRREAEAALRRSERELADFFDNATIGLHWVGPDGIILRVNQAELGLLGYSREEYVGHHIAGFHADQPAIEDILARLSSGEKLHERPARLRCKDGSIRDVLIDSSVYFENGRFIHTRCFTHDITERKRAEQATVLLSAIVDSSDDAIISKDLNGVVTSWNKGAERIFGYTAAEAVGQPITMLVPPDRLDEEPAILARLKRDERVDHFETIRVRKDGSRLDVSLTISPVKDAGGRIIGASKVARDTTERKRMEEALREADRRKEEFLATLSHELRNPLAPLRNSLHLLRLAGSGDGASAPIHEMMERQVGLLVRLVDDLLEVSRISRGTLELRKEQVAVAAIVRNAIETSDPLIQAAGHKLSVSLPEEPLWLEGDPVRLTQILANLLNNAAKYTGPGGDIRVQARRQDGQVTIAVRDNGAGIAPGALPSMFEMFTRGEHSSGRSQGGLGIGLALSRRLAEMHGGTLTGRSEGPGKGAEFTVRLPLAGGQRQGSVIKAPSETAIPQKRILVVDDNRDGADSLSLILRFLGADVQVAHDGSGALAAFDAYRPEVVLLDIGMPGMDGYEVVRRMRQQPDSERVAIVALTGWGQEEDRKRSREAGFDHHLIKPADIGALRALLASLHDGQRGRSLQ